MLEPALEGRGRGEGEKLTGKTSRKTAATLPPSCSSHGITGKRRGGGTALQEALAAAARRGSALGTAMPLAWQLRSHNARAFSSRGPW